jgi:hypothetical protein
VSFWHLATGPHNSQRGEMDDIVGLNLISIGSQIEHKNRRYIFENKQHIVHCFFGIHRFIDFVGKSH